MQLRNRVFKTPSFNLQVTHVFLQRIEEMEREAMDRNQQLTQLAVQVCVAMCG